MRQTHTRLLTADLEQAIRARHARAHPPITLNPRDYTGIFQADALAYWRSTGLSAEEIVAKLFPEPRA